MVINVVVPRDSDAYDDIVPYICMVVIGAVLTGRVLNFFRTGGPITDDGLTHIASYKYVPGDYTPLDKLLGPLADWSIEWFPMWMAPNVVTTIGACCVLLLVAIYSYYSPTFEEPIPSWAMATNGLLLATYYWLDWLDGKQARRTRSSSPLGQLFDHGVDCFCIMGQFSLVTQIGGPYVANKRFIIAGLALTQCGFHCAQLVEYYYNWLPHALAGVLGATEINFGLSVTSVVVACMDRAFLAERYDLPVLGPLMGGEIFIYGSCVALLAAVFVPLFLFPEPEHRMGVWSAAAVVLTITACSVFVWPDKVVQDHTRLITVASWLVTGYVTVQVIIFSLAKQDFSRIQWPVVLYCSAAFAARLSPIVAEHSFELLLVLSFILLTVVCEWVRAAMKQLTDRLGIRRFHISAKSS